MTVSLAPPPRPAQVSKASAKVYLRFEDVTQDGRLVLEALPNALGPTIWRGILAYDPSATAAYAAGIVPILTRFVLEGAAGPFSANVPVEAEGACRLAKVTDAQGDRYVLDAWADLQGSVGRTYGPVVGDGERALVGRIFAEHVLTRPFAGPGQRRVTRLDYPGAPHVTATRDPSPTPDSIASIPEGASPLEPGKSLDPVPITFGIVHTDSNLHVNSLVYVRLFEEAALRRFAALGKGSAVLGRFLDITYRKPCFAGQVMHVVQQAFEHNGQLGMVAVLVEAKDTVSPEALAQAKPHAYARMLFEK